ncbi:hypothetical protein CPB85DRAFT_646454 [Mucidula mucida]|nr:hypothetical protein CPB85DRAFT_646454 [Mucidula mucida]
MSFPQELIDAIVDKIHDVTSLRALAIVSTAFGRPSQAKIFRKLHIPSLRVLDLFSNVIAASPRIASLPQQVTLTDNMESADYGWNDDIQPEPSWLSQESKLFTTLQSLPRLQATTINTLYCGDALSDSNAPLRRLISLPNIHSVTLEHTGSLDMTCHRLFSLFIGTSVQALELDRCDHFLSPKCDPGLLAGAPFAPRLQLTSLSIVLTPCLVAYLASPACIVNFSTLRHFTLSTGNDSSAGRLRSTVSELFDDNLVSLEANDWISSSSVISGISYIGSRNG